MTTGEDVSLPPLLELMGEKPKQVAPPPTAKEENKIKAPPYPELNFNRKTPEKKEDNRPIAKIFKRGKDNKPIIRTINFGDPEQWGEVYGNPPIYYDIEKIVSLDKTDDGPILVELKDGKKFFSGGAKYEQTCNELDTDLSLSEIKAQYWK